MKKNFALFSIVILFCGTLGCKRDSSVQPRSDTITIKKVCHDISDFKKSLAALDVLGIQNWVIEESLSNAFLSVTSKLERVALLSAVEKEISTMPYASVDARKCRYLYSSVARAYSAVQDSYWNYADAPALAVECWFAEINHFKAEMDRCRREMKTVRSNHDAVIALHELEDRILLCNCECEKTYYKIDICGFMGESFYKRHPESRGDFVERVRKLIGRYPEWYSSKMGDSGVHGGNH